ncbi:hypothetical protein HK102_007792 [Quaeritorhiza haematococci]|nr:hypothetical protein HK102_007792 [Quaeritorhiza haematococci]
MSHVHHLEQSYTDHKGTHQIPTELDEQLIDRSGTHHPSSSERPGVDDPKTMLHGELPRGQSASRKAERDRAIEADDQLTALEHDIAKTQSKEQRFPGQKHKGEATQGGPVSDLQHKKAELEKKGEHRVRGVCTKRGIVSVLHVGGPED